MLLITPTHDKVTDALPLGSPINHIMSFYPCSLCFLLNVLTIPPLTGLGGCTIILKLILMLIQGLDAIIFFF